MDDTISSLLGIVLAVVIMFIFPLITMADRTDDVSQLTAKIATANFAKDVMETGKVTNQNYNKLVDTLGSTRNSYDIQIEAKILDENPSRKSIMSSDQTQKTNSYYSIYTSQILDQVNTTGAFFLKEGDVISVSAKNTSQTIAQQLKNFFYTVAGKDTYIISATSGGIVTVTGM